MYKCPQFYQPPLAFGHLPLSGEKIPSLIGEAPTSRESSQSGRDHEVVERLLPDRGAPPQYCGGEGLLQIHPLNPTNQGDLPIYFPPLTRGG